MLKYLFRVFVALCLVVFTYDLCILIYEKGGQSAAALYQQLHPSNQDDDAVAFKREVLSILHGMLVCFILGALEIYTFPDNAAYNTITDDVKQNATRETQLDDDDNADAEGDTNFDHDTGDVINHNLRQRNLHLASNNQE
jgi:hypothetical protein